MINEKNKNVLILEGKGGTSSTDIDPKTKNKMNALIKLLSNGNTCKYVFKKAIKFNYNENNDEITYCDWKEEEKKEEIISYNNVIKIIREPVDYINPKKVK